MGAFEKDIGYSFQNPLLFQHALTHPSALHSGHKNEFERLEFLGDRVLGLVIASWLFEEFPSEKEGDMAKRFTSLVRKETLVSIAESIGLDRVMVIKREKSPAHQKRLETMLADGCEALIGALFLDGGFECAQSFVRRYWQSYLKSSPKPPSDPKSQLQEWVQSQGKDHPTYVVRETTGPAHAPRYIVEVCVQGCEPVQGEGTSKQLAEKDAAKRMLEIVFS
jgi:ribonuclease-3